MKRGRDRSCKRCSHVPAVTTPAAFDVRAAGRSDDADLRHLLRTNPMEGEISVSLEREPDVFLSGSVGGHRQDAVVARDAASGRVAGMASRSVYDGFLNGVPRSIGYLGQLRVSREFRGRAGLLTRGYAAMRARRAPGDLPFDLTTIVVDNVRARRVLEAGLEGVPAYRPLEELTTLIVPLWRRQKVRVSRAMSVERGSPDLIDDIVRCMDRNRRRCQFAPRWTASDVRSADRSRDLSPGDFLIATRGGAVAGCLALWDQSRFKQIVVRGYGPSMRRWRPWTDLSARLIGTPSLPAVGEPLSHVYVSHLAVDDDDEEIFGLLLAHAYNAALERGYACAIVGLAARHPFLRLVTRAYRAWAYSSILYAACWEPCADVLARIDSRVPHLEVGLL
jgi:hypothetical protein